MSTTIRAGKWLLLFTLASAYGCEMQLHEPGVYKGKVDPLIARSADEAFKETLRERLKQTQTDR